jgi:hypothetical protein
MIAQGQQPEIGPRVETGRRRATSVDRWSWLASTMGFAAIGFALALVTRADPDLWGHLRFGLDLIRDRHLTDIDPYSFTQDKPWVNHEWLSELQMALAYSAGGTTGLLLLKASMLWIVWALVWRGLRDATIGVRVAVSLVLVGGTIHVTSSVRPQLWSFLCLALECAILLSPRAALRWWLPPLFAFWVNCHGGWIVGMGVLGAWAATQVWESPGRWRSWAAIVVACVAATLVNPYGAGLWAFIASTVRMERPDIDEWRSLWTTPVLNWIPWALAVLAVPWMWRRDTPRRLSIATVLVMLAYASARVLRIESLFVLAAAVLIGPALAARWPRRGAPREISPWAVRGVAVVFLVVMLASSAWVSRAAIACVPIRGGWVPDVEAMTSLGHAAPGRIVVPFNWGEYALWHLAPRGVRISMDGRRETVYSDARVAENDAALKGTPQGLETLARWNPEYVWLPKASVTTTEWLVERGYRIDVETGQSRVVVRSDVRRLPAPGPVGGRYGCFPG